MKQQAAKLAKQPAKPAKRKQSRQSRDWSEGLTAAITRADLPIALVDNGGNILHSNPEFKKNYKATVSGTLYELFDDKHADQLRWLFQAASLEGDKIALSLARDKTNRKPRDVLVQYWPVNNNLFALSLLTDYSTARLADVDILTQLANRRKARMLLDVEAARSDRSDGFCLAIGDIDHFKQINDTHGHDIGDNVLKHVSQIMQSYLRGGDWVARWGGEEFLIFLPNSDIVTGMQPIERIRAKLEKTGFPGPPHINVTMSFGLVSSASGGTQQTLIEKADTLLYEAKNNGRNRTAYERTDDVPWVINNILDLIQERQIVPHYMGVYNWRRQPVAVGIKHGLKDGNHDEQHIQKMLSSANRLQQRTKIDGMLMDAVLADLPKDFKLPCFFPLSEKMLQQNFARIKKLHRDRPLFLPSISLAEQYNEKSLEKTIHGGLPIVLTDFNPHALSGYVLSESALHSIVFPQKYSDITHLKRMVDKNVKFYITSNKAAPTEKMMQQWKKAGYAGYASPVICNNITDI